MSTQQFWDAAAPLIDVTEKHPFLVSMVDGTLDIEKFRYYVVQDALYLKDFADNLHRLANRATSEIGSNKLKSFAIGVEKYEMDLHRDFFVQWDISADGVEQMPNTLLYTSYLKRVVATCCHEEGLAALLPCYWVYLHIGKGMLKLRDELGTSVSRPKQFDIWIDMYAGDEFENKVRDYIAIVDDACKTATSETLKEMENHFVMSCKLEHMFWDQAEMKMEWPEIVPNTNKK